MTHPSTPPTDTPIPDLETMNNSGWEDEPILPALTDTPELGAIIQRLKPHLYECDCAFCSQWVAARSAILEAFRKLQEEKLDAAERELVQKYRGFASTGQALATTNAGVFLTYPEWNRITAELASLRANTRKDEK
jgi:hypothetical protein